MIDKNIFEKYTEDDKISMGMIKSEFVDKILERISDAIKEKNYKISEVIKKTGISKSAYYSRITRSQLPPLEALLRICAILECDCGYLLCEFDEPVKDATNVKQATNLTYESIRYLIKHRNDKVSTAITSAFILEMDELIELIQHFYEYQKIQCIFDKDPHREIIKKMYNKYFYPYDFNNLSTQNIYDKRIYDEKLPKSYSHEKLIFDLNYYNDILSHKHDALMISFYRVITNIAKKCEGAFPANLHESDSIIRTHKTNDEMRESASSPDPDEI